MDLLQVLRDLYARKKMLDHAIASLEEFERFQESGTSTQDSRLANSCASPLGGRGPFRPMQQ
jgi:hypothetical protein